MSNNDKKGIWAGLSPKNRKTVVTVSIAIVGFIVLWLFMNASPDNLDRVPTTSIVDANVLTGEDTHALGVSAMSSEIANNREGVVKLGGEMKEMETRLQRELDRIVGAIERTGFQLQQVDQATRDRMGALRQAQQEVQAAVPAGPAQDGETGKPESGSDTDTPQPSGPQLPFGLPREPVIRVPEAKQPNNIWANPGPIPFGASSAPIPGMVPQANTQPTVAPSIKIYSAPASEESEAKPTPAKPSDFLTLPTGSIISGVLLSGIDGITGLQGSSDPVPVLMRVKHQALLPNRFKADVRECFVVLSTQPDLSSERVMMRGETFSCVNKNGGIVETDIKSFVTGEDGKAGLRGKLVHRSGQLVSRAALAGLVSGLADVFKPMAVTPLGINSGNSTQFQTPNPGDALGTSGYSGVNRAGEMLAEYWIKLADKVLPVLEVEGGRAIDMVLLRQLKLRVHGGAIDRNEALASTNIGRWYAVGSRLPTLGATGGNLK